MDLNGLTDIDEISAVAALTAHLLHSAKEVDQDKMAQLLNNLSGDGAQKVDSAMKLASRAGRDARGEETSAQVLDEMQSTPPRVRKMAALLALASDEVLELAKELASAGGMLLDVVKTAMKSIEKVNKDRRGEVINRALKAYEELRFKEDAQAVEAGEPSAPPESLTV